MVVGDRRLERMVAPRRASRAAAGRCRSDRPRRRTGYARRPRAPFSSTTTESSGLTCFSRIAAASPAGPAPTITTSNSMLSRSISLITSSALAPRMRAWLSAALHSASLANAVGEAASRAATSQPDCPASTCGRLPFMRYARHSARMRLAQIFQSVLSCEHMARASGLRPACTPLLASVALRGLPASASAQDEPIEACGTPAPIPSRTSSAASRSSALPASGTRDDPIVIAEELNSATPGDAGHPRDPADPALRLQTGYFANGILSSCASRRATTAARPGSSSSSSCRRTLQGRASSATACPSTSAHADSGNISSDSFAKYSRDFEPYDRLLFTRRQGRSARQGGSFSFLITDFTPRWQFYLVQDPRIPSS